MDGKKRLVGTPFTLVGRSHLQQAPSQHEDFTPLEAWAKPISFQTFPDAYKAFGIAVGKTKITSLAQPR